MKKLKVLALSDLHLGEPEGLLNNNDDTPNIRDVVIRKISEVAKGGDGLEDGIEELVLIGDIADLSEAPPEVAYRNTQAFLTPLLRNIPVDKVVYIPGNHDHHLWVEMVKAHYGKGSYEECTPKTGPKIILKNPKILMENCIPKGYQGNVEAYYPYYLVKAGNSSFLFDHGHLFSSTLEKWADTAKSIEEIEEKAQRFMEILWFQGEKSWKTALYKGREVIYDWSRRLKLIAGHSKRGVSFKEDSTPVYDDGLRDRIISYLESMVPLDKDATSDLHLIFGHTHFGGRVLRDDRKVRINGRFITLWNTGGWLVPSEVFSPDAYIFYIEQTRNGLQPQAYKLVAKDSNEEGDYDRGILNKILKNIG